MFRRRRKRRIFSHQADEKSSQRKLWLTNFVFVCLFLIIAFRLFSLQVIHHSSFLNKAEALHNTTRVLTPKRGLIYFQDKDKKFIPVAINKQYSSIYAVPEEIENPEEASQMLASLLPSSAEEIFSRLNKPNDPYEPLLNRTDDETLIQKIKDLDIKGIYIGESFYRYYPLDSLGAHLIGFTSEGEDNVVKGRYGLESYYNDVLSGKKGVFQGMRDALGRLIRSGSSQEEGIVEGVSLVTTIDKNIQFASEKALEKLVVGRKAAEGSIIVMDPRNGKILALANYPTFDLNKFSQEEDYMIFQNDTIESRYEPGSVMKPITMATGLDLHAVTPETSYVDKGYFDVGGYKLVNYKNEVFGRVNMNKVLEMSINTGAIFVSQQVGGSQLRQYFKAFGLDRTTGIDLPREISGDLSNMEYPKANPTYFATASFGVGVAITPMELLRAFATIANKGKLVTPYIVESLEDNDGFHSAVVPPEAPIVISPETAETLTTMLVGVIENGFGGNAKVKSYSLAGKTGTAYIPLSEGKGYSDDVIHTFVGFFPAYAPRFVILVKMDRPQWGKDAASHTVTLAFREVEKFIINYYNMPPDEDYK